MAGGYVGWGEVVNQAPTSTGGAARVFAQTYTSSTAGASVGGLGVVNTFSGAPSDIPATALRTRGEEVLYTRADEILEVRS